MGYYNPEIHHRRSIRLKDYDYSQMGAYFVTICTFRGKEIFGEVEDSAMILNRQGAIASAMWQTLPRRFSGLELDHFVVMPNHIHGILVRTERLKPATKEPTAQNQPSDQLNKLQMYRKSPYRSQTLCEIVRTFKGVTSYYVRRSDGNMTGFGWHRNFFEHIIRNGKELDALRAYILNNPTRWQKDKLHPQSGWKLR